MPENLSSPTTITENIQSLWGLPYQVTGCPQCKKVFLSPANRQNILCPSCARSDLQQQPVRIRNESPEMVLPFSVDSSQITAILEPFVKDVWIHPDDFDTANLAKRASAFFVPMWLVDCDLNGNWQIDAGFDYQVKSSQESYQGSSWQTTEVVEGRIRWEARKGLISRHYDNIAAVASSDFSKIFGWAGPFSLDQSKPYDKKWIGTYAIQAPDLHPESAWPEAQSSLLKIAGQDCAQAANAQHNRNLNIQADYQSIHWTQLLIPVISTYYMDDDGKPQMVFINGQTGKIGGLRLASQRKGWQMAGVSLAIALGLLVLGLLSTLLTPIFPPIAIIGGILIVGAFAAGIFAIIPAAWPWQWNRKQLEQKIH